jgi:hypothetical protein
MTIMPGIVQGPGVVLITLPGPCSSLSLVVKKGGERREKGKGRRAMGTEVLRQPTSWVIHLWGMILHAALGQSWTPVQCEMPCVKQMDTSGSCWEPGSWRLPVAFPKGRAQSFPWVWFQRDRY